MSSNVSVGMTLIIRDHVARSSANCPIMSLTPLRSGSSKTFRINGPEWPPSAWRLSVARRLSVYWLV